MIHCEFGLFLWKNTNESTVDRGPLRFCKPVPFPHANEPFWDDVVGPLLTFTCAWLSQTGMHHLEREQNTIGTPSQTTIDTSLLSCSPRTSTEVWCSTTDKRKHWSGLQVLVVHHPGALQRWQTSEAANHNAMNEVSLRTMAQRKISIGALGANGDSSSEEILGKAECPESHKHRFALLIFIDAHTVQGKWHLVTWRDEGI